MNFYLFFTPYFLCVQTRLSVSHMNFNIDASASEMRERLKNAKEVTIRRTQGETAVIADGETIGLLTSVRIRKSPTGDLRGFFEFWGNQMVERAIDHLDIHLTHIEG